MKPKQIRCIGGGGYLGSRVVEALEQAGHEPIVYDLALYENEILPRYESVDILQQPIPDNPGPTIWLASFHKEPNLTGRALNTWRDKSNALMVSRPLQWALRGDPFIYISSAQVFNKDNNIYSRNKRAFESQIVSRGLENVQILRFGTVWGGLDRLPNRPQTALNAALLGQLPGDEYQSYGTHIGLAVSAMVDAVELPSPGRVVNILDSPEKYTRKRIAAALNYNNTWRVEAKKAKLMTQSSEHPTKLLASYYGIKL